MLAVGKLPIYRTKLFGAGRPLKHRLVRHAQMGDNVKVNLKLGCGCANVIWLVDVIVGFRRLVLVSTYVCLSVRVPLRMRNLT